MSALEHSLVGHDAADGLALIKGAREHLNHLRNYWSDCERCVTALCLGSRSPRRHLIYLSIFELTRFIPAARSRENSSP